MKIQRNEALHIQIANYLRNKIRDGEMPAGHKLKPEQALSEDFQVSRTTVRAALKILEHEGYIVTKHGSGTYVSEDIVFIDNSIEKLRSTSEIAKNSGLPLKKKTINLNIRMPNKTESQLLGLNKDEKVVNLERICTIKQIPIIYSIDIFPLSVAPELANKKSFEGSLFVYFEEKCHIRISSASAAITAAEGIPLRIGKTGRTVPAMLLEQIHYDGTGKAILYSLDYFDSEHFKFHVFRTRDA